MKDLATKSIARGFLLAALLIPVGSTLSATPMPKAAPMAVMPADTVFMKAKSNKAKYRDSTGAQRSATKGEVIAIPPVQSFSPADQWEKYTPTDAAPPVGV